MRNCYAYSTERQRQFEDSVNCHQIFDILDRLILPDATTKERCDMARRRATAVIKRGGKVLLVKDRGKRNYSLPGGGINHGEPSLSAAAREVYEETKLRPRKAEFLFRHLAKFNDHRVYLIDVEGEIKLDGKELEAYLWWDERQNIPTEPHVKAILSKIKR